jgi:6-pyruvoyltetrahydropterin/6-carboxytetrahydropterin synthase
MWLEDNWDHKFLAWEDDDVMDRISDCMAREFSVRKDIGPEDYTNDSIVWLPFNPTAENMAQYLVNVIGPQQLAGTGVMLESVTIDETAKCSASYTF